MSVTDEGPANLKQLRKLKDLSIEYTDISDNGVVELAGLDQLTELRLRGTRVTRKSLANLRNLKNLESLLIPDGDVELPLK